METWRLRHKGSEARDEVSSLKLFTPCEGILTAPLELAVRYWSALNSGVVFGLKNQ